MDGEQLFMFTDPRPSVPREMVRAQHGDKDYRWWLTRDWGAGPQICWIMLNPSLADDQREDPTLHRIIGFSRRWGYGRLVVVNLYPCRSPNPADCQKWQDWENNGPDWYARDAMMHNLEVVKEKAAASKVAIAAWGAAPWAVDWADHVAEGVSEVEPFHVLQCLGATKDGAPKHPLARGVHRISDDQMPKPWREV